MQIIEGMDFEGEAVESFLQSRVRHEGLIRRKPMEELTRFEILWRPFREVLFKVVNMTGEPESPSISLVDESLGRIVKETDHRMLLWRPKYSQVPLRQIEQADDVMVDKNSQTSVESVIDEIITKRKESQEFDDEIGPELRRAQADPIGTIALIVPRSPGGVRREKKMLEDRSPSHAYVLASSLVTNTSPKDIITSATLGRLAYVHTVIVEYESLDDGCMRHVALEAANASTLTEAEVSGKPLTRLCELYPVAQNIFGERQKT